METNRRSRRWWMIAVLLALLLLMGWLGALHVRHTRFRRLEAEGRDLINSLVSLRPQHVPAVAWNVAVKEVVLTAWGNVLDWPEEVENDELGSVVSELRERVAKAQPETAPEQLTFVLDALESLRPSMSVYIQNRRDQLSEALTWKAD